MSRKYKILLISGLTILPVSMSMSVFGATSSVSEEVPSYLDQQHDALVSQSNLMADTSPQSYTEENTDPFTSFYIGFGANWVKTNVTLDIDFIGEPSIKFKKDESDFGANLNTGYGANLNNFYLGGELFFNYVSSSSENDFKSSNYDYGGDLRFGYIFTHNFMVYILGGVDVLSLKNDVSGDSKTKIGFMPGIGAEYLFNDNWGIRTKYTYTIFPKTTESIDNIGKWDYQIKRSNLGLDLMYHF